MFTTNEQERVSDDLFLSSGDRIVCFFEEEALDEDGTLTVPKERSINKIGHALHDLDPVFERFSYTDELAEVSTAIGLSDPLALQSMYIFKQPSIGGEVGCHQDATFLWTDPISVVGFWFALEDATLENGCLWAAPGGAPWPVAQGVQAGGRRRDRVRGARPHAAPPATGRAGAAARARGDARRAPRPAPPLERRQPLVPQPPRLLPALHLGLGPVPELELVAAGTNHAAAPAGRHGAGRRSMRPAP